jgi:C4-dicarboxylate-specific signal transduction histidine kinase
MSTRKDTNELEQIAKAIQIISKEISYEGLARALLREALSYSGATRAGVLLSEGGERLAKDDADFPREKARYFVSQPAAREFLIPDDVAEKLLRQREIVLRHATREGSALVEPSQQQSAENITQMYLPLVHQEWTIGILYLESERDDGIFTAKSVWVMSILASQAAVSFESVRLFEALRETNMWMVKGQEIGGMGSYRWNTRTLLSRASRECYRIFDIDQHINPVPFEVFQSRIHPDDYPAVEKALGQAVADKSPFTHEYRIVHRDGTILHVRAAGQFDVGLTGDLELEGIISDISAQKAAAQALTDARTELARTTRLASAGELAGSIIHEINQPLTGIIMSAEACLRWLERDTVEAEEARRSARRVIEQAHRATQVVAGLRSLVRDVRPQFTAIDINEATEEVLFVLGREFERADVVLRIDLDRSSPPVDGDRVQLQQVVFNLVRNALEAMTGMTGRSRVLTASTKTESDHVSISIADTGTGFDAANKDRLFDPFYTTKGSGLGLGLSICRKIVKAHGGRLWVEENKMHGATFAFLLPFRQSI